MSAIPAGYKQTDAGVIPDDWTATTVGQEFSVQLGKMLDSEKNVGVLKPYLGNRAVQWGKFDLSDIGEIRLTPSDLQSFRLREGDLLVCEGGEIGRAAIWRQPIQECYFQKALHRLRPTRGYNVSLMLNMLQRLASTGFLLNFVTQTSIAHLPKDKFENVPLPRPPTAAEQEAITEALSDADALIESLEQLLTKKRHLKQAAMQELLTGKKRLPGFSGAWKELSIGELAEVGRGRVISHIEIARSTDPKYPVFSSQTSNNGVMGYLGSYDFEGDYVTWTTDGANAGTVFSRSGRFNCTNVCGTIKPYFGDHRFIAVALGRVSKPHVSRHLGNPKLMNDVMKRINIRIPPDALEQTAIAAILCDMDTELAELETQLAKTRAVKNGMMQKLLTGEIRLV